jgi:long-chain acyl-CoA synthetase
MFLTKILKENNQKFPLKPALTMQMGYRTITLTYKDVYDLSRRIFLFLENNNINKGDKVLLFAPNSPYWCCVFWACLLRGVVAVPLNIQSTSETIKKIAQQTDAKLLFKSRFLSRELPESLKVFDIEFIDEFVESFDLKDFKEIEILEDDIVEILYTSGTTGDPKGVLLTHKNISSNIESLTEVFKLSYNKERLLSILPLTHIFEQTIGFFLAYSYAAHIIYAHSYAAILDLMQEYKITKLLAVPEFLSVLMSKIKAEAEKKGKLKLFLKLQKLSLKLHCKFFSKFIFHFINKKFGGKLDTIGCGGAFLDPVLEKEWNALGFSLLQGYGLTETSPVISCNTYDEHKFGSVGKVVNNIDLRIADDGEILVKGPSVFQGYYKDKEKTKGSFTQDGYFKTGDIGELDKDGFLFLRGRKKYVIVGSGAQNVYPEDIEFELNSIEGVKDSCILGLETQSGMVEIHAVLLLKEDTQDPEQIIERANNNLATYQHITGFSVWPKNDFPRSATRKIKKEEVRKFIKQQEIEDEKLERAGIASPLIQILSQITGVDERNILEQTKVIPDLKLDSLMKVELIVRIEDEFGVVIDETKISSKTTVVQLQDIIDTAEPGKKISPLKSWPRWWWIRLIRVIVQFILFSITRTFVRLRIEGKQNLKDLSLPVIFMPNHLSYADPVVVAMALPHKIRRRISFAAARDVLYEYYSHLVFPVELTGNSFPLPRLEGENIRLGLERMGKMLDEKYSVVIFPEGKMSKTGELLPLKRGAGFVAVEMNCYIVPVRLYGTAEIVPYGKFMPCKRGIVRVVFGKPIKFKKSDSYHYATKEIEAALKEL